MTKQVLHTATYESALTPEERKWADEMALNCKRTDYYDLTEDQVRIVNEWTKENIEFSLFTLDWEGVVERLGLVLSEPAYTYELGPDDKPLMDDKGKERIINTDYGDVKFRCVVKQEGLRDANGVVIEMGIRRFTYLKQATNRPLNETNWRQNVMPRIPKWMVNGETLIKDANGDGISEQHTCVAQAVRILEGTTPPNDATMQKYAISGIHPLASITADTGKANTGADIFGSDPEIVPDNILQTVPSYLGAVGVDEQGTPLKELIRGQDRSAVRTKVCNVAQGSAKLVLLRLGAKDVNASLGNGQKATRDAHILCTRVLPDLDDLAAMCQAFVQAMTVKPVTPSHLTAALTLWYLRTEDAINTIPRDKKKDFVGGTPLEEAPQIRFDLDLVIPFLKELQSSIADGRLADWTKGRTNKGIAKEKNNQKFAQLVRVIMAFYDDNQEEITAKLLNQGECGKSDASDYLHFGGADRGPIPKPEPVEEPEDQTAAAA